jgi:ligand-binding sensor domain-containing protein/signal transduction histidine kinase
MCRRILIVVAVWIFSAALRAQTPLSFEHLSLRHGLSQSVPNDIHQDKEGFLWIATQDGLNRYDGYTFKVFKNSSDDTTTLSHSWIWKVFEDHQRNLWVATWNGLNRYDRKNNRFIRYDKDSGGSVANTRTNLVYEDSNAQLWVGTWGNGLHRYDRLRDTFEAVSLPEKSSSSAQFIRILYQDSQGRLWVGTFGSGLLLFDAEGNKLIQSGPLGIHDERITAITEDPEGNLWLGTYEKGLVRWHPDKGIESKLEQPVLNDHQITALLTDNEGAVWVGTREGGINLYSHNNFTYWNHQASDETSIAGSHIFSLFQDRSGIVWVGSNGLSKFDKRRKKFLHITHQQNVPTTLSNRVVRTLFEDSQGRLWVGMEGGGLNLLDADYRVIRAYRHDPTDRTTISNNDVRAITEHPDGSLWIGTLGGGINRFYPSTGKFIRYSARSDFPAGALSVQHVLLDKDEVLWMGTIRDGLFWYDTRSDRFIKPELTVADTVNISSGYINRIDQDKQGNVWISGWGGGLSQLKPGSDSLVRYLHDLKRTVSLANDIVYCTYQDSKDRLWVGTAGGLNLLVNGKKNSYNSFDEHFRLYSEKHGLSNNVVYGILEDASGKLWLSTNYGLSCFDPELEEFKNYHEDDGLQGEEFNANAFFRSADERLIFGGINGLNIFKPDELYINPNIPPVVITAMNIFEKPIGAFQNSTVHLKHHQNFISFEFVALDFMAPQRNQFAYRLDGLQEEWVMAGQRRYASYTDLKPGTYTFRVRASNNDGVWNEEGAAITFSIASPFWQTWWFSALSALVFLSVMYGIYRYRLDQRLQVERLRTKIASDLHDEVGSSLTRISIYADLLNNGVDENDKKSYLGSVRDISREVVSTMSDIVWSIDNRSDKLGDLVLRMKDFASQILSPKNIEFEFVTGVLDERLKLSPPMKQNVYLIYKEALHNIVKHAGAHKVKIRIENAAAGFMLSIADDGKGFNKDKSSKGNGLRSMQKRAADISASLLIANQNGTSVVLQRRVLV